MCSSSSSSSSDSDSDDSSKAGKRNKEKNVKQEPQSKKSDALNKLSSLLNTMVGDEYISASTKALNKQMARPKSQLKKSPPATPKPEAFVVAATEVAESLGGDVQQTQSELLTKLRSQSESSKSSINLNELIVGMKIDRSKKATSSVEGRSSQVRRAMYQDNYRQNDRNRDYPREGDQGRQDYDNYRQDNRSRDYRRDGGQGRQDGDNNYRQDNRNRDYRRDGGYSRQDGDLSYSKQVLKPRSSQKVDLFNNEALGIFTKPKEGEELDNKGPILETWEELSKRELRLVITHPPANVFEEMILWTEQGKLWQFPIDNEQGLEEEKSVYFAEHVFLEPHLEPWCPRKGPVRHFMELVCVGLSKNPYLTVEEKRGHIDWFRKYFDEKQSILKETGALEGSQQAELTGDKNV